MMMILKSPASPVIFSNDEFYGPLGNGVQTEISDLSAHYGAWLGRMRGKLLQPDGEISCRFAADI
jgi:hypothetical protein